MIYLFKTNVDKWHIGMNIREILIQLFYVLSYKSIY